MIARASSSLLDNIAALIEHRTGIAVQGQLRELLEDTLHTYNIVDEAVFLEQLEKAKETDDLWQPLIDALTIGETYFLRDHAHFQTLKGHLLPELIQKRRSEGNLQLNIWSVGCASGEEPYSIAITLTELIPDIDKWHIRLVGSDLNGRALRHARRGIYRKWAFRHTELEFQRRYFDPTNDGLKIQSRLQNLVAFRHANLLYSNQNKWDIILCRNVLLYFNLESTQKAEELFLNSLYAGGWLLLGQSEILRTNQQWMTEQLNGIRVYQKPSTDHSSYIKPRKSQGSNARSTQSFKAVGANRYEDALRAIQDDKYDYAERILQKIIVDEKAMPSTHVLLAHILASRNEFDQAHQHLDTALQIDPLYADGHYLRAALHIEEDNSEEAMKSLHGALYCQRNHPLASFLLANMYAQLGELKRANRYWENTRRAVTHLTPDSPISDISDISAGQLASLVKEQLSGWSK